MCWVLYFAVTVIWSDKEDDLLRCWPKVQSGKQKRPVVSTSSTIWECFPVSSHANFPELSIEQEQAAENSVVPTRCANAGRVNESANGKGRHRVTKGKGKSKVISLYIPLGGIWAEAWNKPVTKPKRRKQKSREKGEAHSHKRGHTILIWLVHKVLKRIGLSSYWGGKTSWRCCVRRLTRYLCG